jgi:hypothetical protein
MSKDGELTFLTRQIGDELVSKGRKRIITSDGCLGLLLVFNRTAVLHIHLAVCLEYQVPLLVSTPTLQG